MGLLPGFFMAAFFVWPVIGVIRRGLASAGLTPIFELFAAGSFRSVAWFTLWQAALSTALTVLVGLPAARMVTRFGFRGRRLLRALVTVPFVLPTVVVAGAFEGVFDRFGLADGDLRLRHTIWAILLAHLFFNYAVVVRVVGAHWSLLDTRPEDQARLLGASSMRAFREITLRSLAPAIAAAATIVFLFSSTSFGIVLILGGPARATLETEIYRYAIVRLDLTTAAALAVVQLAAVIALVVVSNRAERHRAIAGSVRASAAAPAAVLTRRAWFGIWGNCVVMALLLGVPIAVLVERSLATRTGGAGTNYSFDNYLALAERVNLLPDTAMAALGNSLLYGVAATAMAVLVGGVAAVVVVAGYRGLSRVFDVGLTLPLGTSAVTVGLGMLLVLDEPPLDLRSSAVIVPIAHAVIGVPFVVRILVPMLRSIDPHTREAAAVLGAAPAVVRREIDFPVAARGLVVGAAFAFAVSLGEFGATSFIPRRPETLTAPLALFRLLGTPGDALRGQAMALAVVLMVLVGLVVFVFDLVGDARQSAF